MKLPEMIRVGKSVSRIYRVNSVHVNAGMMVKIGNLADELTEKCSFTNWKSGKNTQYITEKQIEMLTYKQDTEKYRFGNKEPRQWWGDVQRLNLFQY